MKNKLHIIGALCLCLLFPAVSNAQTNKGGLFNLFARPQISRSATRIDIPRYKSRDEMEAEAKRIADLERQNRDLKYRMDHFVEGKKFNQGKSKVLPPDARVPVQAEDDAHGSIKGVLDSLNSGDKKKARAYANQYVRYYIDLMFNVREITRMIGQALVEQEVIPEDRWYGVAEMVDAAMSEARNKEGLFTIKHQHAMERIKPDVKGEIEIYYFMSLDSHYCEEMASDVERLWRIVQSEPHMKMAVLTFDSNVPKDGFASYAAYTGLTMPIFRGNKLAREMGIAFAPTLAILTPNNNAYYVQTGQQSFEDMYDFVRRSQGLPATVTPKIRNLLQTPIGKKERKLKQAGKFPMSPLLAMANSSATLNMSTGNAARKKREAVARF